MINTKKQTNTCQSCSIQETYLPATLEYLRPKLRWRTRTPMFAAPQPRSKGGAECQTTKKPYRQAYHIAFKAENTSSGAQFICLIRAIPQSLIVKLFYDSCVQPLATAPFHDTRKHLGVPMGWQDRSNRKDAGRHMSAVSGRGIQDPRNALVKMPEGMLPVQVQRSLVPLPLCASTVPLSCQLPTEANGDDSTTFHNIWSSPTLSILMFPFPFLFCSPAPSLAWVAC